MEQKNIQIYPSGKLILNGKKFRAALGRGGVVSDKREGDGGTPPGCFSIRKTFYRSDRLQKPEAVFPVERLGKNDGWCDDPRDKNYNKRVKLPYKSSAEKLWREDNIYDIIVVLGFNDNPPVSGKGSAIFIHIARENYSPTDGCIALALPDLLKVLGNINKDSQVCVLNQDNID